MDGINGNYNQYATSFSSQVQQTGNVATASTVGQSQAVSSGSQVRLTESTDKMSYVASHPQLAESANLTAEESEELLQSTSEKLVSAETTCRGKTVMFDIYAILNLIQETSQEMRNAERELRTAENQSIQSNLQAQAELQRTSAVTQLVAGCVSAGVSLTMLGVSTGMMAKGVTQSNQRQNAAGLDVMKQQENILAGADNPQEASGRLATVKGTTPQGIQQEVDAEFAKADKPIAGSPEEIANGKAEQMGGVVDKYQADFDRASSKATFELEQNGKVSPETAAEQKAAGQKLTYARAKQVDTCANMDVKPTKYMSAAFSDVSKHTAQIKESTVLGTASQQKANFQAQMVGQSAMMVNQLGNSVGQGVAGIINAESTALQADEKAAEEQLDQVKDLFNNTQQLIQQTIQLFSSIVQKESQSIEEIIGGIRA